MTSIDNDVERSASSREQLIAAAKERADSSPLPEEWGYRVQLEPGDSFIGRWRGETTDTEHEDRRVFLLWDEDEQTCFSRFYSALGREVDHAKPEPGDTIVLVRGDDYIGQQGTGYSFGMVVEPNDKPQPVGDANEPASTSDIPF